MQLLSEKNKKKIICVWKYSWEGWLQKAYWKAILTFFLIVVDDMGKWWKIVLTKGKIGVRRSLALWSASWSLKELY